MKILVFTEGTIKVHSEAAGKSREEIIEQSLNREHVLELKLPSN